MKTHRIEPGACSTAKGPKVGGGFGVRGMIAGMFAMFALAACQNSATDPALSNFDTLLLTPLTEEVFEGTVGEATEVPVRLQITDETGRPVPNVPVQFRLPRGAGAVTPSVARSDSRGIVETEWVLGESAGIHELEVTGDENWLWKAFTRYLFRSRASAAEPASAELSPNVASVTEGESVDFDIEVEDRYGNRVEDAKVEWGVDDDSVVRIDESGRITALAPGSTRVRAVVESSARSAVTAEAEVQVKAPEPVEDEVPGTGDPSDEDAPVGEDPSDEEPVDDETPVEDDVPEEGDEPEAEVELPGIVSDLVASSVTTNSVRVGFTEIDDGTGAPASYRLTVRGGEVVGTAAASAPTATDGVVLGGVSVGATREYEQTGLASGTDYELEVVAYRQIDGETVYAASSAKVVATTLESEPIPSVERVTVAPSSVHFAAPGEATQLEATAVDATGSTVEDVSFDWSSSDEDVASVSSDGRVTGRSAGTALIVAAAACGNSSDTITVQVDSPPEQPTVAVSGEWSIEAFVLGQVQTSTMTLEQNGSGVSGRLAIDGAGVHDLAGTVESELLTLGFDAEGYGHVVMALTVVEDALDGSIEVQGQLGSVTGARVIEVDDPPVDEPADEPVEEEPAEDEPVGGEGDPVDEPTGFGLVSERNFASAKEDGWNVWQMAGEFGVVPDATSQHGGNVGRMTYPAGMNSTRPAITARGGFQERELYLNFRFKVSENWNGHPSRVNKIFYVTDSSTGGNGSPIYIALFGSGSGALRIEVHRQNPDLSPSQVFYPPNVGSRNIVRGQWHDIEVRLRMNGTGGSSDGEIHVWVDGVKTTQYTSERFAPSGDFKFDAISWEPYWGGQNATLDRTQYMYMDRIHLSGR